jgi:hypothetical protein
MGRRHQSVAGIVDLQPPHHRSAASASFRHQRTVDSLLPHATAVAHAAVMSCSCQEVGGTEGGRKRGADWAPPAGRVTARRGKGEAMRGWRPCGARQGAVGEATAGGDALVERPRLGCGSCLGGGCGTAGGWANRGDWDGWGVS